MVSHVWASLEWAVVHLYSLSDDFQQLTKHRRSHSSSRISGPLYFLWDYRHNIIAFMIPSIKSIYFSLFISLQNISFSDSLGEIGGHKECD